MSHTPGPWIWADDGNLYNAEARQRYEKAVAEDRWDDAEYLEPIAQTVGGCYGPRGADKMLIAAAPDLLAACKAFFDSEEGDEWKAERAMMAAIAKAEGTRDGKTPR